MPGTSSSLDLASIQAALRTHRDRASSLQSRLEQIRSQIEDVESEVDALWSRGSSSAAPARGGRGRRGGAARRSGRTGEGRAQGAGRARRGAGRRPKDESLETYLKKAMSSGKPMGIADLTDSVKRLGYASSSKNLGKIVGMRLGNRKLFKKVGRGQYVIA